MKIKSLVTLVMACAVLFFGVAESGNLSQFVEARALWIVLGGTAAAGAISFEIDRLLVLFRTFFKRVVLRQGHDYSKLIAELMRLSEAYRSNPQAFAQRIGQAEDPFLREAMTTIQDGVLSGEDLVRILRSRAETLFQRQYEDVIQFKALSKYPPAFGLLGTTLSMINLLSRLGNPGEQARLGPAMALGLVATFYGLLMANLFFIPVSESLAETTRRERTKNLIVVEGVRLILARTSPVVLAEELNSFLLDAERVDWKVTVRSQAA